jgi:plasmid maintenance system antidote protein VapI
VSELLNEKRAVTAETAMRLAIAFGTTPTFWMNLQATYELRKAEIESASAIAKEVTPLRLTREQLHAPIVATNENASSRTRRRN